ncbi:FHA domain-containing protein, partial [Corallococcus llansteffanensis]
PAPAPPDEASASSEDPSAASSEEPSPDGSQGESMPEPDGGGAMAGLADKKKFVPLIVMGVVGLTFLALMIAVLAGA